MENQTTAIATRNTKTGLPIRSIDIMDPTQFEQAMKIATMMSEARTFVPKHLAGNPGGCLAVLCQSLAWGMNPFQVAICTADVHGRICYEGKLVQAAVEASSHLTGNISYRHVGDWKRIFGRFTMREGKQFDDNGQKKMYPVPAWNPDDEEGLGVIISGTVPGHTESCELILMMRQCYPRNSTLWATDPAQQICYTGIRKWARRFTPGVILGVYSADEAETAIDVTPETERPVQISTASTDDIAERMKRAPVKSEPAVTVTVTEITPPAAQPQQQTEAPKRTRKAAAPVQAEPEKAPEAEPAKQRVSCVACWDTKKNSAGGICQACAVKETQPAQASEGETLLAVSAPMIQSALKESGLTSQMLTAYLRGMKIVGPTGDIWSAPATVRTELVNDPKAFSKKVSRWLDEADAAAMAEGNGNQG